MTWADDIVGRRTARQIEDVTRLGVRLIIQTAVEAEVDAFLGRARYQRCGCRLVIRPGQVAHRYSFSTLIRAA